jgi:hypothetical protein
MWSIKQLVFGEKSVTKVAGLFASKPEAVAACQDLQKLSGFSAAQIRLLGPTDGVAVRTDAFDRAVEPEEGGIWHTIIRAHVTMGLLGAVLGILAYAVLMFMRHPALVSTPGMGLIVLTSFGATFGLITGGALALRPDHGWLISLIRRALNAGQWAVVAHPLNTEQTHRAMDVLGPGSLKVVRSF